MASYVRDVTDRIIACTQGATAAAASAAAAASLLIFERKESLNWPPQSKAVLVGCQYEHRPLGLAMAVVTCAAEPGA